MSITRFILATVIFVSFITSVVFSLQSFTGYLISDQVNNNANLIAFSFFLIGVLGTWLFLAKFKNRGK